MTCLWISWPECVASALTLPGFSQIDVHDMLVSQYLFFMFRCTLITLQGRCSKEEKECKYKHSSPLQCGIGNDRTTWTDVLAREGEGGYITIREGRGGPLLGPMSGPGPMMGGGGGPMMGGMMGNGMGGGGMDGPGMGGGMIMDPSMGGEEILILRKENNMLRMEIEELRKKNDGLLATNRFLLEENANIRWVRCESTQFVFIIVT